MSPVAPGAEAGAIRELECAVDELRRASDLSPLEFERSDQLVSGEPYLGQQRAFEAIRFGLQMESDGYNVFVLGPAGSDRHQLAEQLAGEQATDKPAPDDWCYVNNFSDPDQPRSLRFPAGRGAMFRNDTHGLIEELRLEIPAAFESEDYRNQLKAIDAETKRFLEAQWNALKESAESERIGLLQTPTGYVLVPIRDERVLGEKEFAELPDAEREKAQEAIQRLSAKLQAHVERLPQLRKEHRDKVRALDQEVMTHAVGLQLKLLKGKYQDLPLVVAHLDELQQDIVENAQEFREPAPAGLPFMPAESARSFSQYEVNLFVSNDADKPAPVVYEPNPNYHNVIGRIEHRAEMGALVTDFRLLRAGALHRANGGYLLLDMQRLLGRPFVWEALKQALYAKRVRIESPGESYGLISSTSLQPEPIPLDLKILLIGERWLYYLLCFYDSEFNELFKVGADIEDDLKRTDTNDEAYAMLIADAVRRQGLLPFSKAAMERVIEQRARAADDSERLSMHMRSLNDLLSQASYWAGRRDRDLVEPADVDQAILEKDRRLDRVQVRILDAIERDILLIDTSGTCAGQVNGLSVIELGGFRFGHPVRITATSRMGAGELVDIEREVKLGGAIHSKGMLILSAFLSSRYAAGVPLSLHGYVVFEQSYGSVEGDSASVGELCALLSSLSGVPIRQNIAVTGSINQLGRVQVVGGINEKIEGFFAVCKARGLDGSHGVIIPRENVKHLMLRQEVVDAARAGQFRVYAVQHVDQALTILTGEEAGQRGDDGEFPQGSVNARVERQLTEYARLRQQFGARGERHEPE